MRLHVGIVGMEPTVAEYTGDSQGSVESYETDEARGQFLVLELNDDDLKNIAAMGTTATLYFEMPGSWATGSPEFSVADRLTDQIKQIKGAYSRGQD